MNPNSLPENYRFEFLNIQSDRNDKQPNLIDDKQPKIIDDKLSHRNDIQLNKNLPKISNLSFENKSRLPAIYNSCIIKNKQTEKKIYTYKLHNLLNTDQNLDIKSEKIIHLCIFNIIEQIKCSPYILYLLNKDVDSNILYFPHFTSSHNVLNLAEKYIKNIFEDLPISYNFKGYIDDKNENIYIFYELYYEYTIYNQKYKDLWWWVTLFEIVNIKTILNFNIDNSVSDIFIKYPLLLSLFNNKNNIIPIPSIGYFGGYHTYIAFIASFGSRKASPEAYLGPYYYFDTYKGAGRYAIWNVNRKSEMIDNKLITIDDNGKYDRGGIVRFVIFTSKTKFLLNRPSDPDDDSKISAELAVKVPFIKSTMKIRDVAGKWVDDYDSLYIGSVLIKNKKYDDRVLNIQLATRDYNQQMPLSYHYVDTNQFSSSVDTKNQKITPFNYTDYNIE